MIEWLRQHLPVLPIVVPLGGAALVLLVGEKNILLQRIMAMIVVVLLLLFGVLALQITAAGRLPVYLLGNWQAPFGIVLALDKLTAIMLMLTALISAVVLAAACAKAGKTALGPAGPVKRVDEGVYFYPLFLLQLMGLNGAFLTADLFNLFVFFEVLLAASYGMLLQHSDRSRTNAASHYVVINLFGSALFLIGVSLLYGVTGTLNMSDLSQKIHALPAGSRALVASAGFLLLVVFSIKSALLPLNFWLTGTYGRALLPVAALFALMTKVGVVAIARTLTLIYPDGGDINAHMRDVLLIVAPVTLLAAAFGALAARELKVLIGWSVVGSAAMIITAMAIGNAKAISGALFYLIGSTVATALLFLNAAAIDASSAEATRRAKSNNSHWAWTGALYLIGAAAMAGVPPFAGFIGKAVILMGAMQQAWAAWILTSILTASLLTMIAYARMGSRLFWKRDAASTATYRLPTISLAMMVFAMTIFAAPIQRFTDQTAIEMTRPQIMIDHVLGKLPQQPPKKVEVPK